MAETCKSRYLCSWHGPAETCKAYWFNRGPKGFGRGHLVSDTLVERPSSGEERKWGWGQRKSRHRGVAWKGAWIGDGDRKVEPDGLGGGLQDGLNLIGRAGVGGEGDTTLGGSCVGTLGRPGIGNRGGWKEGGASSHHDSKMSRRLVMASTWEMLVGGKTPNK